MNLAPKQQPNSVWARLVMSVEDRLLYPSVPPWDGGFRWFRSANIIDLQHYRNPVEKERIRTVLLRISLQ